jgi:DnaJ like chaperone protein
MSASTVMVLIIIGIVVYALYNMMKKPAGSGNAQQQPPPPGGGQQPYRATYFGRSRYGKWIGGGLGWAFGGPIGAILGFAMGSMFDGSSGSTQVYRNSARGDFAMSLLVLAAAVMKADQKVVRSELDYVRNFFIRQFGEEEGTRFIQMLREILKQDINLVDVSTQVGHYMDYSSRLQILHFLFGIAASDGMVQPEEANVIETIAQNMGVTSSDFNSVKAMFITDTNWAYDVLEITKGATDDEVKKAYRELAKKHHPDKVAHLGEDVKKAATEKFQKINAAYNQVKAERGIN